MNVNVPWIVRTPPIAPPLTRSTACWVWLWWRYMNPSVAMRPVSRAVVAIRSTSSTVRASGFSHRTCFPAWSAAIVHCVCRPLGSGCRRHRSRARRVMRRSCRSWPGWSSRARRPPLGPRGGWPPRTNSLPDVSRMAGMTRRLIRAVPRFPIESALHCRS